MATILAALAQRGLIERTPGPEDDRRQVVSLTEADRERAESDRQVREERLTRAMQERNAEPERRIILDALSLLERLTENRNTKG